MASLHSLVNYGGDSENEDEQGELSQDTPGEEQIVDPSTTVTDADNSKEGAANGEATFYVGDSDEDNRKQGNGIRDDERDEIDQIALPPEADDICSLNVQKNIISMMARKTEERSMNKSLQRRKDFRNPSIYEKLVEFCSINETGTNYPQDMYNPKIWGPNDYYSILAKVQKEDYERKEKAKQNRTQIDFVKAVKRSAAAASSLSTTATSSDDVNKKRKSKWDIGAPSATSSQTGTTVAPTEAIESGSSGSKKSRNN